MIIQLLITLCGFLVIYIYDFHYRQCVSALQTNKKHSMHFFVEWLLHSALSLKFEMEALQSHFMSVLSMRMNIEYSLEIFLCLFKEFFDFLLLLNKKKRKEMFLVESIFTHEKGEAMNRKWDTGTERVTYEREGEIRGHKNTKHWEKFNVYDNKMQTWAGEWTIERGKSDPEKSFYVFSKTQHCASLQFFRSFLYFTENYFCTHKQILLITLWRLFPNKNFLLETIATIKRKTFWVSVSKENFPRLFQLRMLTSALYLTFCLLLEMKIHEHVTF